MKWDFGSIFPFILMILFYLVPELLKRRKKTEEYKYPEIPDQVPLPDTKRPIDVKPPPGMKPAPMPETKPTIKPFPGPDSKPPRLPDSPQPATAVNAATTVPVKHEPKVVAHVAPKADVPLPVISDASPGSAGLDQTAVWNGVVFAEILQPPRAHRPFKQRRFPR